MTDSITWAYCDLHNPISNVEHLDCSLFSLSTLNHTAIHFPEHEFLFPFQIFSVRSITRNGVFDFQGDTFA